MDIIFSAVVGPLVVGVLLALFNHWLGDDHKH